jgi:capsule polysaccharide export protein KpsE/RkpR
MGILKSKIRSWSLPQIVIIYRIIIIIIVIIKYYNYIKNAQYNYYMSNKGLPDECDKKANVAVTGLLLLPVSTEDSNTFCPMSRIRPITASPATK